MQIIRNRAIVEDDFVHVPDGTELPAGGKPIVTLARYVAAREVLLGALSRARGPGAERQAAGGHPRARPAGADRDRVPAVHRWPRLLGRAACCASATASPGELRAVGWVLRDQLYYLERCGFNAFELKPGKPLESALEAFGEFSATYQAATDDPRPIYRRR